MSVVKSAALPTIIASPCWNPATAQAVEFPRDDIGRAPAIVIHE